MEERYFISAPIEIHFDLENSDKEIFYKEFTSLEQSDEDPIGQWLKVAKARGDARDTDPLLLTLISELHRKVDDLTQLIKGVEDNNIELKYSRNIEAINYDHIRLEDRILISGNRYYGRVIMPTFPRRDIPIYFNAIDEKSAIIEEIHDRDKRDWDAYVAARERAVIRERKSKEEFDIRAMKESE